MYGMYGNAWKRMEMYGHVWKCMEMSQSAFSLGKEKKGTQTGTKTRTGVLVSVSVWVAFFKGALQEDNPD